MVSFLSQANRYCELHPKDNLLNWLLSLGILPLMMCSFFFFFLFWLVIRKRVSTWKLLTCRGLDITDDCYICENDEEKINHFFMTCKFVKDIWDKIEFRCPTTSLRICELV